MNKEKVLALADYVEASRTFDMSSYTHDCDTPACLAGHGARLFWKLDLQGLNLEDGVASELDIAGGKANKLFRPVTYNFHFSADLNGEGYITKEHAVATLRHLAKTGEVDYDKCAPK